MKIYYQEDAGGGMGGVSYSDGGGGGESSGEAGGVGMEVFNPPAKQTVNEKPLPGEKMESSINKNDPQQPQASSGTNGAETPFDPKTFAETFGKTIAESLKPALQPKQPEMTQEEARKLLNFWEPDDAWYTRFDNLETRKAAIGEMRDGLTKYADTVAQLRMHEMIQALRDEIAPGLKEVQTTASEQRNQRFNSEYPQLAEPALQPLIQSIAEDMVRRGQTFTNEREMFKAIAAGAQAVIKVHNPDFVLDAQNASAGTQGRTNNSIPVTTPGSGGGAGRRENAPKQSKARGIAIFDQ